MISTSMYHIEPYEIVTFTGCDLNISSIARLLVYLGVEGPDGNNFLEISRTVRELPDALQVLAARGQYAQGFVCILTSSS